MTIPLDTWLAALRIGCSRWFVTKAIKEGQLKARRYRGKWIINQDSFERWRKEIGR